MHPAGIGHGTEKAFSGPKDASPHLQLSPAPAMPSALEGNQGPGESCAFRWEAGSSRIATWATLGPPARLESSVFKCFMLKNILPLVR